jgi:hypothetical protein
MECGGKSARHRFRTLLHAWFVARRWLESCAVTITHPENPVNPVEKSPISLASRLLQNASQLPAI